MRKYKLAFALAKYFEFGGLQRDLMRIARECVRRGHEAHIYASEWDGKRPQDLMVHLLSRCALTNHGSYRQFGRALQRAVAAIGFDCVIGATNWPPDATRPPHGSLMVWSGCFLPCLL